MRDPGTPRRNPFFERASDGSADDLGMGWSAPADEDPAEGAADRNPFDGPVGGFATLLALVEGLSDAQPDAAEHLVAAAHEVVLTVKVIVDATEAVLAQQRAAMAERSAMARDGADGASDQPADGAVSWLHQDDAS
ncbi:MAG: hypothetical protein JJE46_12130 [Acidimicrobiia bacterium]|nr:hypothetical protein [Acidimicrobiia bacterium]